jgi:hypothetical protein
MTQKTERPFSFYLRDKEKVTKTVKEEMVCFFIREGYTLIIYFINRMTFKYLQTQYRNPQKETFFNKCKRIKNN